MNNVKRLLPFLKPYWPRFLAALAAMSGVAASTALLMLLVKDIVDKIFIAKDTQMLLLVVWIVPCLFMIKAILSYVQNYLMVHIGLSIIMDMRNKLFHHLQKLSLDFYHKSASAHIISRMTNDLGQVQAAISNIPLYLIRDGLTAIGLVSVLFYLHWKFALIAALVFPIASIPIVKFGRKMRRTSRQGQAKMADLYALIQESLQGIAIVKAFSREEAERDRFSKENRNFFNVIMRYFRVDSLSSPVMELLGGFAIVFIIWYGGRDVIRGVWTTGGFFSFLASTLSIYGPLRHFAQINSQIQMALSASERVFELLEETPSVLESPHAKLLPPFHKEIVFENVSFSYRQGVEVLRHIDLNIPQGHVVAVVGPSGSGKTTLAHLLLRFYDPTAGRILIDGENIRDVTLASLRNQIGLVTQDIFLFNDSLRQNILFGKSEASEKEIRSALQAANAEEFVKKFPDGLDTMVGERGVRLSGGQKQRIAIARAVLKNPPLLILDEATSALDTVSERLVQEALENLMRNRTVLVIAHRLSTIQKAHRIVVLEHGSIVETGDHDALMAQKGAYRRLYQ